jgi:pilus assembly protein CpaB
MGNLERQRVLMIFGAALVCAFLMSWFVYAKTQGPKTENLARVVAAARDMSAGTRLKPSDVKLVGMSEKDVPKNAMLDPKVAIDRVLLFPMNANEPVVTNKLTVQGGIEGLASTIEPGKRAVSVPISDSTGAGGLIQPRSHVDVLFTRTGSMNEAVTTVLLQNITVMSIGRMTEAAAMGGTPGAPAPTSSGTRAATLLVAPDQAAKLEFARQQGKISLALRNPLDTVVDEENQPVIMAEDVNVDTGGRPRARRPGSNARMSAMSPNIKDDEIWKRLTAGEAVVMTEDGELRPAPRTAAVKEEKTEPPKPRYVVDVFKGDKHLQEVFQ